MRNKDKGYLVALLVGAQLGHDGKLKPDDQGRPVVDYSAVLSDLQYGPQTLSALLDAVRDALRAHDPSFLFDIPQDLETDALSQTVGWLVAEIVRDTHDA